jgi:phage gp36-like protein
MESVKLEQEAEIHANQLAKEIIKRAMEWFPLIRQFKEGKVQEDVLKQKIVKDVVELKGEMQARFTLMGESYENTLKDHTDSKIQQIQIDANKNIDQLRQIYESKIIDQELSIERIAERYMELETQYILPILEKLSEKSEIQEIHELKLNESVEHYENQSEIEEEMHH